MVDITLNLTYAQATMLKLTVFNVLKNEPVETERVLLEPVFAQLNSKTAGRGTHLTSETRPVVSSVYEVRFPIEAGALVRGAVRRSLAHLQHQSDATVAWTEEKGWLESLFSVTISGERDDVDKARAAVHRWMKEVES